MIGTKRNNKAYLEVWLSRMRKEFSGSGRLTEIAYLLSKQDGRSSRDWQQRLREIVDGEIQPGLDEITRLEALVAKPAKAPLVTDGMGSLFD